MWVLVRIVLIVKVVKIGFEQIKLNIILISSFLPHFFLNGASQMNWMHLFVVYLPKNY